MNEPQRTCEELGVCQDRLPPCNECKPSEGRESVIRLLEAFRTSAIKFLPEPKP